MSNVAVVRDMHEGHQVKYVHLRYFDFYQGVFGNMGGVTVAFIEENGVVTKYAVSYCSLDDNFSRKDGRDISRERLKRLDSTLESPVDVTEFIDYVQDEWIGAIPQKYLNRVS